MNSEVEMLDWKAVEVLETLADLDGRATTSEIRDYSAVETNQEILYRVDEKLGPEEYITSFQPTSDIPPSPPKEFELTSEGERIVSEVRETKNEKPKIEDLPDKVEYLSGQLNQAQSMIAELEGQLTETEDKTETPSSPNFGQELAELRAKLQRQQEQLTELEQRLTTFEEQAMGVWSSEKQEEFETLWSAMLAMRQFIENEVESQTDKSLREYR